jgi:uncharacterized membrane protein
MQKEAAWLLRELTGLVAKGVLDQAAAGRLRAYYAQAAGPSSIGWGMILLATGGAALIGLGVMLIFAHNWENWTPEVRVGFSLLPLLIGQVASTYALRNGSRIWSEAAGVFTTIAIGASIALIAQTYQFGSDLPRFLLTWLLLALPLVYLLDASAVASLCWLLASGWVLASHDGWWRSFGSLEDALRLPTFLALFCLPMPHLIRHIRLDRAGSRVAWMLRVGLVAAVVGLALGASHDERDALFLIFAGMAAAAALAGQSYFAGIHGLWGNPLRTAGHIGVFILTLLATSEGALRETDWPQSSIMILPLLLGIAALWLSWETFRGGDRLVAPLMGALAPMIFILPIIGQASMNVAVVLGNLYALALAAALIRAGLRESQLGLANEGVALLAALILLRFFDSDLSYVVRGVGFIITGIAFFAAVFWLRRRLREAGA